MKKLFIFCLGTIISSTIALAVPLALNRASAVSEDTNSTSALELSDTSPSYFFTDSHHTIWEFTTFKGNNNYTGITASKYIGETPSYVLEYELMMNADFSNITYDDINYCQRSIVDPSKKSVVRDDLDSNNEIDIFDLACLRQHYLHTPYNFVSNGTDIMDCETFWNIFEQKSNAGANKFTIMYDDTPLSTTTTAATTTIKPTASTTASTTTSTVTYYECEFDGEYYWNQEDEALGPDSGAEVYKFLMETIELYGFEHFKIVWSRELIPYAWVLPDTWTAYNMHTPGCFQVIPSSDMETICNYYTVHEKYFLWRPAWADYNNCPECSVQHYQIHNFTGISFVIDSFYQIIPTDENGNDILTLGSNIPKLVESFTS